MAEATMTSQQLVKRSIVMTVSLVLVVAALTDMFLSMRAVMEIGGSCGSGGAVVYKQPCPDGVGGLMTLSIMGGLAMLAVYAFSAYALNLTLFAWPALFLSLGYNFWDYGINPPDSLSGGGGGFIVCGVLFVLMGGIPLVIGIWALVNKRDDHKLSKAAVKPRTEPFDVSRVTNKLRGRRASWSTIDGLERLSKMHARGELDDDEYEKAKDQVLADEERT